MRNHGSHEGSFEGFLILLSALAAIAVLAAGCSNDLPMASRLERTRVLGARVQVAADPGRADVMPGETASVEWLVAGPRAPGALTWAFALCSAIDGDCAEAAVPAATGTGTPVTAPFTAPPATSEGDVHRPLMFGAVCEGVAPAPGATPDGTTCAASSASANVARFQIPMPAPGAPANRHPNLANDVLELDGAAWTASAAPPGDAGGPCDSTSGLPVVTAGASDRQLRLVTDGDDRESFVPAPGAAPELEELQISNFVTAGKLAGSYEAVYAADTRPDADVTVKWTPPAVADVSAAGLGVQFHFVVRDGRGGLDWVHRALCVVAP